MKELKFKNYQGIIADIDFETEIIHGEVLLTKDVVIFGASNIKDLIKEFKLSINAYLEFCKKDGIAPDRALSGEILVRCGKELQSEIIKLLASKKLSGERISQNEWCKNAIRKQLEKERVE